MYARCGCASLIVRGLHPRRLLEAQLIGNLSAGELVKNISKGGRMPNFFTATTLKHDSAGALRSRRNFGARPCVLKNYCAR
jgi:hypothetical protein